jgi:hypothetical protein
MQTTRKNSLYGRKKVDSALHTHKELCDTNLAHIQLQSNTASQMVNVKASIGQRLLFSNRKNN